MKQNNTPQNPWLATNTRTGADYDRPYELRAQQGEDIHGEANLVEKLLLKSYPPLHQPPYSVMDAGCGTGRMGIEFRWLG